MAPSRPKDLLDALSRPGVLPQRELEALTAWASTFFPFQRRWAFEPSRAAICCKSRKIGISHSSAAASVLWATALAETTTVLSLGQTEANEVLDLAAGHVALLRSFGSQWAKSKRSKRVISFDNGGSIVARPSSSGGRGKNGNVFFDEFAFAPDDKALWDAGAPIASLDGSKIRVVSTPNGVGNEYWKLWTVRKPGDGWATHLIDVDAAIAEGYPINKRDALALFCNNDPRLFAQNYQCNFLDGELQYIPTEYIERAVYPYDAMPVVDGTPFAGIDFGRKNDLTVVVTLVRDVRGQVWVKEIRWCKQTSWDDQMDMIQSACADWNWKRVAVDATGMGSMPTETLQRRLGQQRVEAVEFGLRSKEMLATGLYQWLAAGEVWLQDDEDLQRDLASIRRIITKAGNITYEAPHTENGHADRAWALALALHACGPRTGAMQADLGPGDFKN